MADFSKQWCENNDPEIGHDFDILEVANSLEPNHYIPYICEGYGFIAIAKSENGEILLGFNDENGGDLVHWVDYKDAVNG